MPSDQTVAVVPGITAHQTHWLSWRMLVLLVGGICLLLSAVLPDLGLRIAIVACGLVLLGIGRTGLLRDVRAKGAVQTFDNARRMIEHDVGIGFLTDRSGTVRYANGPAQVRFGTIIGHNLAQVFELMLANPASVLSQMMRQTHITGVQTEDIVTRGGHFRLRLLVMGTDCQMWWLDDLTNGAGRQFPAARAAIFPMISVATDGQIIVMNDLYRGLFGTSYGCLDDLFADLPLKSGQTHELHGLHGPITMTVAIVDGKAGQRNIYLLPTASGAQLPPQLEADWSAIEDLPVPLLKVAPDGSLLGSNREARKLLNIQAGRQLHLGDVLNDPGRPINDWLAQARSGQAGHVSQVLHGRGDKQDTFVQVTLSTAGDADDAHLIAVLNDVTELRSLETQFVQSQKMQAIGQLAGGVAHDFNNLLTAISGHCELLLTNHDEHDQDYSDLMQIHQNTNRAASLVGQLLAFSRKQNLQLETIDLRDTLSNLTHLLNRLVGEKVTLTLDHDPQLAKINADKRQLEQVLMNLVVNARDAMQGAGDIRVVTKNCYLTEPLYRDRAIVPVGDYVLVKVIDQGQGIPADKLTKIFEPFFTTKRTGEGTGLGLSTAYGIVKQTGGYIFVDTKVGFGTTFSLYFPQHSAAATCVASPTAGPAKPTLKGVAQGVVLLVEDEAPVRAFASRALRLQGYTVLEAEHAEAALRLLENRDLTVDIFVTDVIMPGLDGPTWVRLALKDRPNTKVVFVSGYPEDAFDDGQPQVPDAAFLPKPFSLHDLTSTVQAQLQMQAMLQSAS